jgi:energy-coupling factor transport system permease protein
VTARLPRDLHPVAWWLWAIGLAAAASLTTNPLLLLLLVGVASVVVMARRSDQPWARSFRLYVWVGVIIVVIRVVFRVVFGGGYPGRVVLDLPLVPLPDWVAGITLLGPVTREALLAGLYDGLRLATIVICIGAANSLANPKRLLRSVPPALYEIGTALVVAVTVLPQFADSVRRVLRACGQGRPAGSEGCGGSWCRCSRTPSSARSRSPPAWTRAGTAGRPVSRPPDGRPPAP